MKRLHRGAPSGRPGFAATLALVGLVALVAPLAAQEDRPTALLRGPVVSTDGGATDVDVVVAPGTKDVKLVARWGGAEHVAAFAPLAGQRLRARIEPPAGTDVLYDVIAPEGSLARATLTTLPAAGSRTLTFCALGDSGWPRRGDGAASPDQLAVARLLDAQRPQLVLHTGDIIYLLGQPKSFDALFFRPYAATLARVPLFVTLGNHDVKTKNGAPALDEYPYPTNQNGNRFYSFDAANVHFACLDSNEILDCESEEKFLDTPQGKWLKGDLAAARSEWKLVWFHHPLYSVNAKGHKADEKTMRHVLQRFLDDAGVDIVLTGHDHFYHRSVRLRDGKPSDQGMIHIITGGGGAPLYEGEPKKKVLTEAFASRYHIVRFDVDGLSMRVRAIGTDQEGKPETFDDATIPCRKVR